jgi:probable rRNA maturation factor
MRVLNRTYRHTDAVTDVLAFPASGERPAASELGDIVIATGVARRQAREHGHPYADELRVLALHGLLHLLGYDHHAKDDRGRMARVESLLRRKGGLKSSLIDRNTRVVPRVGDRATTLDRQRLRPRRASEASRAAARGVGPRAQ